MRASRRIVFVNRFFYPDCSATSQLLSDLAFHLVQRGWEVCVVASRQRYDAPGERLPARECVHGVDVHRVWTSRFGRSRLPGRAVDYLTFYAATSGAMLRLLRQGDLVVTETDPPLISVPAGWIAQLRGARLLNWLQDLFPEVAMALGVRGMAGFFGRWLRRLRNRSLQRAVMNVVLGERMRARAQGEGVSRERIVVIPNWADAETIQPVSAEKNPLCAQWGLEGRFVVGYSGNLGRAHEIDTLLGALERLKDEAGMAFVLIGGGAQFQKLQAEVAARGISNVSFQDYQPRERLSYSLSVSDVHLVMLRPQLEGLIVPSKLYGIAAAARPTIFIGDEEGEIARVLRNAGAGVTVRPGDAEGLVSAIQRLRRMPELRRAMGNAARRMLEERYAQRLALAAWEEVLEAVMRDA